MQIDPQFEIGVNMARTRAMESVQNAIAMNMAISQNREVHKVLTNLWVAIKDIDADFLIGLCVPDDLVYDEDESFGFAQED